MSEGGFIFDRLQVTVERIHPSMGSEDEEGGSGKKRRFVPTVRLRAEVTLLEAQKIIEAIEPNHAGFLLALPVSAEPVKFDTRFTEHRVNFRQSTKKLATMDDAEVYGFTVGRLGEGGFWWEFLVKAPVTKAVYDKLGQVWIDYKTSVEITKGDLELGTQDETEPEEASA